MSIKEYLTGLVVIPKRFGIVEYMNMDEDSNKMKAGEIAKNWKSLSGDDNWKGQLDSLNVDLRVYIIHYGEMAEANYDAFIFDPNSRFAGNTRYGKEEFFEQVGLVKGHPFRYSVTKFVYGTSSVNQPNAFMVRSEAKDPWSKQSNWIGFVAVATDEGKAALGRRDIVVSWRGTIQASEWMADFDFPMVPASKILGKQEGDPKVHEGFLSVYTSDNPNSQFNKSSARDQVLSELKRLHEKYKNEEVSVTVTGHSLGAALATLCAVDIACNGYDGSKKKDMLSCEKTGHPVTAFAYASPKVGDAAFKRVFNSFPDLHALRIRNKLDVVPDAPQLPGYEEVGEELPIDTQRSNYLKQPGNIGTWHNLEGYLHGVAGTHGRNGEGPFKLEVKRDIALVNKNMDGLKDEYLVPPYWWIAKNTGMFQQNDGSWKLY